MKKRALSLLLTLAMVVSLFAGLTVTASATEEVYYTLDGTISGGNSGYADDSSITQDSIEWNIMGNTIMTPWRIGGKSLSGVDRTVASATAMGDAITKVALEVGTASSITVNSLQLIVASDSAFSTVLDTVNGTFAASSTINFTPTSGTSWASGAYYKFVFNVTVSGTSNKFLQFTGANFYHEASASACTHESTTLTGYVAATCTVDGYTGDYICDECGSIVTAGTVIPATGHTYVDGVCTVCGAEESAQAVGWYLVDDYTNLSDGVYAILSPNYYAFNGTINSSGQGQHTDETFSFDANGYAAAAPTGTLELIFTSTANGFTLYDATLGYLYIKAASAGNLAFHEEETSGWSWSADGGLYAANNAHLRCYNDTFRTYGGNSNAATLLAYKYVDTNCQHTNATLTAAVSATCTTDGNTAYYYCPDCLKYFTDNTFETETTLAATVISATGHTWGEWSVTTPATCTAEGEQTRTCSVCQATDTEAIPATGHTFVDGVCTVCGAEESAQAVGWYLVDDYTNLSDGVYAILSPNYYAFNGTISSGHGQKTDAAFSFDANGYAAAAPSGTLELTLTNTANGFTLYDATLGYLYASKASSGGLAFHAEETSGWSWSADGGLYAANNAHLRCYNDTFRTYAGNMNGTTHLVQKVESSCTHNWVAGSTVLPTCTTAGYTPYTCSLCGATKEDNVVAALGHTWDAAVDNNNGTHTMTCSVCNAPVTEDCTFEVLEAGGNEFECTVCGSTKEVTQFYKNTTVADGNQVVIYHPTSGKALTATASGAKLAGVEVPSDYYSTTKLCIPDDAVIMTVADYNNGQFHLTIDVNGSTLYLTSGATGNSVSFAAAPAQGETDYGLWEIDATTGLVLKNVNAAYNGNQQALEVYNNLFTTYQANTTAAFQMELFIACTHENTTLTGAVAATCVDAGYTGDYVCDDCGATVTAGTVIPATGHTFVDGVCTVCGAVDTQTIDLKIETASLTLYEDIVVNFAASVPTGLTDPYMIIEVNGQSYTVIPNREDSEGRLVFEFTNLTPDMMGDNIKSTVYATTAGGQLVHYCKPTYSVRQYCTNVMAAYPEDAKLQTLLADMLVYGAATQTFTGHNADSLVTAGLDLSAASTFTDPPASDLSMTDTTDANIQWTGAGLECGSRMSMYFTLTTTAGDATSVSVTINGRTTVYEYADIVTDDPTVCRVVFRGISASEYGDVVTAVVKNNGAPVQTLTYSVNSYINSKYNDPNVENLAQLAQAIYNYGASASSYIN